MPYAPIYRWGPNIQDIVGLDGKYFAEHVALALSQQGADADDLAALASAEAAWRVDSVVDRAEAAGIDLTPRNADGSTGTGEEVVSSSVSQALEQSEPKVLCGYRNHRGEGCTKEALPGAGRCGAHGGLITDPEVRRSLLLVSFAKIIDGSMSAVEALLDVAENGRSEMARVQAAKEILDRAGVAQDQHVHIHRPEEDLSEDDMLDELRNRLSIATNRLRIKAIPVASEDTTPVTQELVPWQGKSNDDDEIVDATIVED